MRRTRARAFPAFRTDPEKQAGGLSARVDKDVKKDF